MEDLTSIFSEFSSDKGPSFHNYCRQYDSLWRPYRDLPVKILEIGVFKGESLNIWRKAFKSATVIVGIDINHECIKYSNPDENIIVEIGNSSSKEFIEHINRTYGPFDIILDDGSHVNKDVIISFELLFPLLNDNGLYIVEDTICYKSSKHIVKGVPTHLEYFHKYTHFLNQWRFDSTSGVKDHCVDPFKIQKTTANLLEQGIDRIEFGCSYIAIHKKIRTHWIP